MIVIADKLANRHAATWHLMHETHCPRWDEADREISLKTNSSLMGAIITYCLIPERTFCICASSDFDQAWTGQKEPTALLNGGHREICRLRRVCYQRGQSRPGQFQPRFFIDQGGSASGISRSSQRAIQPQGRKR